MLSSPKMSLLREDLCGIHSYKWNSWTCIWNFGLNCTQFHFCRLTINYENHSINTLSESDPSTLLPCEVLPNAAPPPLSSCSSHFFPSYSFCSNSLASFLFLSCVRLLSVSGLLHLLFLGFSFPSFFHDSLICVLQVSDPLSLLRVDFLGDLLQLLSITPVHFLQRTHCCL